MKKIPRRAERSRKQRLEHYEIEKELAETLKHASKDERKTLYPKLYDELYRRVPHHPQLTRKSDPGLRRKAVSRQLRFLSRFFSPERTFLELGAGDCALSLELCKHFKRVYAIDVSEELTKDLGRPANFELIISDGSSVDVMPGTVHIAYSWHLIEHLHPDDALDQLRNIFAALVPGGVCLISTPHKFMGPSDISRYFGNRCTGLHLKEYTIEELYRLCRAVGFRKVEYLSRWRTLTMSIPIQTMLRIESAVGLLPRRLMRMISRVRFIKNLLSMSLVATK